MFVKTLSQTPNSQRQYANLLLAKAAEKPEMRRFSDHLTPELHGRGELVAAPGMHFGAAGGVGFMGSAGASGTALVPPPPTGQASQWRGSIVGEIAEDGTYKVNDNAAEAQDHGWNSDASLTGIDTGSGANAIWVPDSISVSDDGSGSLLVGDGMDGVWMKLE